MWAGDRKQGINKCWPNRTACGTKLLLAAVLVSHLDCISLCHILKASYCSFSPNEYFNYPSASHLPPTRLPINLLIICDITETEKNYLKTSSIYCNLEG